MAEAIRRILTDEKQLSQFAATSFLEYDTDKSGYIDEKELGKVMNKVTAALNCPKPTASQLKELFHNIDQSSDGKISLEEFKILLKKILNHYLKSLEQASSTPLGAKSETPAKARAEEAEIQVNKQLQLFEKYLQDSGISTAFQIIFTEILMKKIEADNVFTYTAMRLRQIGREVAHLLPANLAEKITESNSNNS